MGWYIKVTEGPDLGEKAHLTGGSLTLGRDREQSSFVINDRDVSREHARILLLDDGKVNIEDLGSTNGTYVNNQKINTAVEITAKDVITIGGTQIALISMPSSNALNNSIGREQAPDLITIGREYSNDLVLDDPKVSRSHAQIDHREGKYFLTDLNSTQGTRLNGDKINGTVTLPLSSWINICGYNYFFDGEKLLDEKNNTSAFFKQYKSEITGLRSPSMLLAIPFQGKEALKWFIGSILSFIPVISFFAEGYRYRLYQNGSEGSLIMPEWEKWGDLFVKGLLFFLIKLVYLIPGAALLFIFVSLAIGMVNPNPIIIMAAMIPGGLFLMAASFLLPMAWGRFAASGRPGEAFMLVVIIESIKAVSSQYLASIALVAGLWILIALASLIPIIGFIFSVVGVFFIYIISGLLFGNLYRQSRVAL